MILFRIGAWPAGRRCSPRIIRQKPRCFPGGVAGLVTHISRVGGCCCGDLALVFRFSSFEDLVPFHLVKNRAKSESF